MLQGGFRSLVVFGITLTCFSENTRCHVGQSKLLPLGEKNLFSYKRATPEKAFLETSCPGCLWVWLAAPCVCAEQGMG